MKQDTHPQYFEKATITCACGKIHSVGSTREKTTVEICSNCHPFYTGKEKLVDTAGRVEKFKSRQERAKTSVIKKAKAKPRAEKKTSVKKSSSKKDKK